MKSKRLNLENEVVKCIKKKPDANPFIALSDITSHLFLLKSLGENPKQNIMLKKYRAKKHHAKELVKSLLAKNIIKVDNKERGSFVRC
jgi:hypothetical protein